MALHQVQPRNRKRINNTGIGTPKSHSRTQPTFPSSPAFFAYFSNFIEHLLVTVLGYWSLNNEAYACSPGRIGLHPKIALKTPMPKRRDSCVFGHITTLVSESHGLAYAAIHPNSRLYSVRGQRILCPITHL